MHIDGSSWHTTVYISVIAMHTGIAYYTVYYCLKVVYFTNVSDLTCAADVKGYIAFLL